MDKQKPSVQPPSDKKEKPDKRPYEAPRILSDEPLEAVAATCSPATGGFGKSGPLCGRRGS